MYEVEFLKEATFIVKRNTNAAVVRVAVRFDDATKHLSVIYCFDHQLNDDYTDWCELTCGELIAAFAEIKTAETTCCVTDEDWQSKVAKADVVYSRASWTQSLP